MALLDFKQDSSESSLNILVRATDQDDLHFEKVFTITVTDVNEAPTDVSLSASSMAENSASGTAVGGFSSTDPDTGNTFTYSLVAGTGDEDNAAFTIVGGELRTAASFDYETQSSYGIRVRTTDQGGLTYEKVFSITVNNVNEAPTDIQLSGTSIDENASWYTSIGTFSATDPDANDWAGFDLVSGTGDTDNSLFTIEGDVLKPAAVSFDFETQSVFSIRVRVSDMAGLWYEKVFAITVNNVNEVPVATDDSYSVQHDTLLEAWGSAYGCGANLFENDIDGDGDALALGQINGSAYTPGTELTLMSGAKLTVNSDGTFIYVPAFGYVGSDYFSYEISDGALTDTGSVTISIVNVAPMAADDSYILLENQTLTIGTVLTGLLGNDMDADGDALNITQIENSAVVFDTPLSLMAGGSLTLHEDGTFEYTPPSNTTGTFTFSYTLSDGAATDTVYVTLTVLNNPLVANEDLEVGEEDENIIIAVLANDLTVGGTLMVNSVGSATNGTAALNLDGTITYCTLRDFRRCNPSKASAKDG